MSKKKLRLLKYLFLILSYLGLFIPTLVLFIANRKIYFVKADGWTIGFGGVIAFAYLFYVSKVGLKKFKPIVGSLVFMIVCYCFKSVADYIFVHSIALFIGVALYSAFGIPYRYFRDLLHTYVDEEVRVGVRRKVKYVAEDVESGRC